MFTLRPYQEEAAAAGAAYLLSKRKKNGIMVLPTGSGKSIVISAIADRLDAPLIVLQPSKEILEQNLEKFHSYGYSPAVFSASKNSREVGEITLGTIGTVVKHPELFEDFQYLVMDEAHLANARPNAATGNAKMYHSFFKSLKVKVLGLTASPYTLATNSQGSELRFLTRQTPRIFSDMVYWVQNGELFDQGYLAKLEYYHVPFKRAQIQLNSAGTDYNKNSLQKYLWEEHWTAKLDGSPLNYMGKVVEVVERALRAGRKHVLVFTATVKESDYLASHMENCAVVSADTPPADRAAILSGFKSGSIKVITNCGVLVLGFDFPELDCVIDAAPSMSLTRVYQKIGRVVRPHPDKESAWVVDMADSYGLFGRVEDLTLYCKGERGWGLWGRPGGPEKKEQQLTNVYFGVPQLPMCRKCKSTEIRYVRHEETGANAMLSLPTEGMKPYIVVKDNPTNPKGAKIYNTVGRGGGEPTHVHHSNVCGKKKPANSVDAPAPWEKKHE